jgi:hypothetical protein
MSSRSVSVDSSDEDSEDGSEIDDGFREGHPVKVYSGLEANVIPGSEKGSASGVRVGSWVGVLILVIGVKYIGSVLIS